MYFWYSFILTAMRENPTSHILARFLMLAINRFPPQQNSTVQHSP